MKINLRHFSSFNNLFTFLKTNATYILYVVISFLYLVSMLLSVDITAYLFGALGLTYIIYIVLNGRKIDDEFYMLYVLYGFYLLVLGILNNNFKSYIYWDLFSFCAFIFIFISGIKADRFDFFTRIFPLIGVIINIIAIALVLLHILNHGLIIASMSEGRLFDEQVSRVMSPKQFMYGSLFFYPLLVYLKSKKYRLVYDLSILLFIFLSLAMGSRGTTLTGIVVFVLTTIRRTGLTLNLKSIFKKKALFVSAVLLIMFVTVSQIPQINDAVEFLAYRFTAVDEDYLGASRTEEAKEVISNLSFREVLLGRGLGAANTYWIFSDVPNGVNNVHYGWIFLILKGGIIFLILIYGKIIYTLIKLWRIKQLQPYSVLLITFLLLECSHTNFISFYNVSFLFIAISAGNISNRIGFYSSHGYGQKN